MFARAGLRVGSALWLSILSCLVLAACAPQTNERLPDAPETEKIDAAPIFRDPATEPEPGKEEPSPTPAPSPIPSATPLPGDNSSATDEAILKKYAHLDPKNLIPRSLLNPAILYFERNASKILNKNYLTIIDFAQSSTQRRMFIVTIATGDVWAQPVSHGRGSDINHDGYAEKFSNVEGSHTSSLGFYLTAETYQGSHGYSLRLDGLSPTNSRARERAIVIHGARYVQDREVIQGRSWGCPAVANAYRNRVINMLKNGSLIYAERSTN